MIVHSNRRMVPLAPFLAQDTSGINLGNVDVQHLELQGVFKGVQFLRLRCLAQVPRALRLWGNGCAKLFRTQQPHCAWMATASNVSGMSQGLQEFYTCLVRLPKSNNHWIRRLEGLPNLSASRITYQRNIIEFIDSLRYISDYGWRGGAGRCGPPFFFGWIHDISANAGGPSIISHTGHNFNFQNWILVYLSVDAFY